VYFGRNWAYWEDWDFVWLYVAKHEEGIEKREKEKIKSQDGYGVIVCGVNMGEMKSIIFF